MTKSDLEETFSYQLKVLNLPEPIREHRFHPERKFRFDFAWLPEMIAVEIEGGTWSKGRHNRPMGFGKDCEKYNEAQRLGWVVYRFTGDMVKSGEAINFMEKILNDPS